MVTKTRTPEKRRIEELTAQAVVEMLMLSKSSSNQAWLIIVNILRICIKALIK
jgi:hypothetical protein